MMTFYEMETYMQDYSKMRLQEAETERLLQLTKCQSAHQAKFNLVEMIRKLIGSKNKPMVRQPCVEAA